MVEEIQAQVFWAKLLHKVMVHPNIAQVALSIGQAIPPLPVAVWKLTRES